MQALIETRRDGSVAMEVDSEAARAIVASVVFAARFHEGILPLARLVEKTLQAHDGEPSRGALCQ